MNITAQINNGEDPTQVIKNVVPDPLWDLGLQAQASGMPKASVRVSFGDTVECLDSTGRKRWPKCDVSIQLECPQTTAIILQAKEYALRMAVAYVSNALLRAVPDYTGINMGE
jgi:hypothetical protein